MKAIVYEEYGQPDVLHITEVAKPVPGDDEVLVKIHAVSINYVDWHVMTGKSILLRSMNGLFKPRKKILGDDIAGVVESVGPEVKHFKQGDAVFGICDAGGFAEYRCLPETSLALKPTSMTFEQAAAIPTAGITALQGVRDQGQVQSDQKVLIIGASGGVGMYAIQVAKSLEAHVTGVCSSRKMDFVRSIGADQVIDYTKHDFTQIEAGYDFIFAIAGDQSVFEYQRALLPGGTLVCAGGSTRQYFQALLLGPFISLYSGKKFKSMFGNPTREDYQVLIELFESGKLNPNIDKIFPLSEVPAAMRYYGEGNVTGKIVINVEQNDEQEDQPVKE
jgi:NADPH:quinone reductase-like Zn-dependent oxidoreductase